jgi:hypothetical protein
MKRLWRSASVSFGLGEAFFFGRAGFFSVMPHRPRAATASVVDRHTAACAISNVLAAHAWADASALRRQVV